MPNSLGSTGLVTATQAELVTQYTGSLQAIYGASINLGPETPDGQWMMLVIQSVLDLEDLLVQIYNMFDPDNAIGSVLDQRVAINGIQRQAGTYTVTNITIVTTQSVNLYGLDQTAQPVYTVSDNAGNQYQLQSTVLGTGVGSFTLAFQCATPGAITPTPNTITVPVSIVLGVSSINNPTTATTIGLNEETDAALKIRRQKSVSLPSQGYLAGLLAALENITGVTFASVQENNTGTTIASGPLTGLPGHSIWVIVGGDVTGSATKAAIANAIYTKRNAGCGMYNSGDSGAQSYTITQVDGSQFVVYWDEVVPVDLFIKFTVSSLDGVNAPNIAAMLNSTTGLIAKLVPGVFQQVNVNELATDVQSIDPNSLVTNAGFSTSISGSFTSTLTPSAANQQFVLSDADIVIVPMYITSPNSTVSVNSSGSVVVALNIAAGSPQQFTANGGYGTMTWSLSVNNSGGSINAVTGAYSAGPTPGNDTVLVTDSFPGTHNTATVAVTVT